MEDKIFFVLFPGAFGNRNETFFEFWFRCILAWIAGWKNERDVQVIRVVYQGTSLKNLIQGALRQLDVIPAGATVVPICYSLGGVFMELVAERRPDLFTHPIGIGTNGVGAPLRTIFRTIKSVWKRFLVGLLTGQLVLDRAAANSLFWYGRETPGNLDELLRHAHPQPMRGILGLARTMIWEAVKNIFRREKRLPWSTFASATVLVPERCAISTGTRFAPGVTVITCPGGHAVIFSYREIRQLMETAVAWIDF